MVWCVYVCGYCAAGLFFALTTFYIRTPYTTSTPHCQPQSSKQLILFSVRLTVTVSTQVMVPYAESPKKGESPLSL